MGISNRRKNQMEALRSAVARYDRAKSAVGVRAAVGDAAWNSDKSVKEAQRSAVAVAECARLLFGHHACVCSATTPSAPADQSKETP